MARLAIEQLCATRGFKSWGVDPASILLNGNSATHLVKEVWILEPYPAHVGMVWFLFLLLVLWGILSLKEPMDSFGEYRCWILLSLPSGTAFSSLWYH